MCGTFSSQNTSCAGISCKGTAVAAVGLSLLHQRCILLWLLLPQH
jgi:hypothetical protein